MPFAAVNQTRLFYRIEGHEHAPVLVLSHPIGTDHSMWDFQSRDLVRHFRLLRYDSRGHGASDVASGDYSIEQLAGDVIGLTEVLKIRKFAFCGLSLGGAIGQWLAIHVPEKLDALILANTSPQFGPPTNWEARIRAVQEGGMAAIADMSVQRFFSPEFLTQNGEYAASVKSVVLGTDPAGYIGCCAALRDFDVRPQLPKIKTRTLVIVGDRDISTPWEGHGEVLAQGIADAEAVRLPAAHLSNIERPRSFTAALLGFLYAGEPEPLRAGSEMRRRVLGDAYVDRANASASEFTKEFQDLITRYAWGAVWARPGLEKRTRRLLALSSMAALGRWEEFRLQISTGLARGLEPCDIKEMLLQTAIYAGVPAANTGFRIAAEEIEKHGSVNAAPAGEAS